MAKVRSERFFIETGDDYTRAADWLARHLDRGWTVLAIVNLTQGADFENHRSVREFWLTKDD